MQQIIDFFIRNKYFLLFCVLFTISLGLTINAHSYHQNRFVSSANFISGGIFSIKSGVTDYFNLKEQNENLVHENQLLRNKIQNSPDVYAQVDSMTLPNRTDIQIIPAKIINNSFAKSKNQLTINKGQNDSVVIDMGVIAPNGIVGIVSHTSSNYASVQSILNTKSQIVAKFKKSNHFGTLTWDTKDPHIVQLKEIPRIAPVAAGDTIVTDGKSTIFPEGIPIGRVRDFSIPPESDYYKIDLELFADMTSVKYVYLVYRTNREEIKQLEKEATANEQ